MNALVTVCFGNTNVKKKRLHANAAFQFVTAFFLEYEMPIERKPKVVSCRCSGALATRSLHIFLLRHRVVAVYKTSLNASP